MTIEHQKTNLLNLDGNNYVIQMASGEILPFAVVYALYDNEDGTYEAYFYEVYDFEHSLGSDPYATLPEELSKKIDGNSDVEIGGKKKAIVKRHDFEGTNRYKLLSYTTIE